MMLPEALNEEWSPSPFKFMMQPSAASSKNGFEAMSISHKELAACTSPKHGAQNNLREGSVHRDRRSAGSKRPSPKM